MSELLYCQKEEITPIADALRELCNTDEQMSLVSMRARIGNVAAEVQEQTDLICQIAEVYEATPSTEDSTMEGNTELLKGLLQLAENNVGNVTLPELSNEGSAGDLLKGKQLIDGDGNIITGTIEPRDNEDIALYSDTGVVVVEPGFYEEYGYNVLPTLNYTTQVQNDNGQAQARLTANSGGYMKPTTDIKIPLGAYQTNVNHTFNDIVSTPHNISKGYVATESSVQIAPAVVSEVETQALLIDRILEAVNSLPSQSPPEIIPPSQPEPTPDPEPTGDLTFVLTTGNSVTMEQLTNIMCSSGVVNQVKLGDEVLWEYDLIKDCEVILAPTEYAFEWIPEDNFGYIGSSCQLSKAVYEGDDLIVVINGTPYRGPVYIQTYSSGKTTLAWRAEGLASGWVSLTDYSYNTESTTMLHLETSFNTGNPITVEIYRTRY